MKRSPLRFLPRILAVIGMVAAAFLVWRFANSYEWSYFSEKYAQFGLGDTSLEAFNVTSGSLRATFAVAIIGCLITCWYAVVFAFRGMVRAIYSEVQRVKMANESAAARRV